MMTVFRLTLLDPKAEKRSFLFSALSLASGLDIINDLVAHGDTLLTVSARDESGVRELPVQAFDGQSVTSPLTELEKQWQLILQPDTAYAFPNQAAHSAWLEQLVSLQENAIAQRELMITSLLQAQHQASLCSTVPTAYYESILLRYQAMLAGSWASRQRALNSLERFRKLTLATASS